MNSFLPAALGLGSGKSGPVSPTPTPLVPPGPGGQRGRLTWTHGAGATLTPPTGVLDLTWGLGQRPLFGAILHPLCGMATLQPLGRPAGPWSWVAPILFEKTGLNSISQSVN